MLRLSLMTSVLSVDDWFCFQLKGDWDYSMDALQVVFANPEHRPGNFVLFFSKEDFKASYLHLLFSFCERLGNWPLHCIACFLLLFLSWPEGFCLHTKTGDRLNQKPPTSSSYFRLHHGPVTSQWRIACPVFQLHRWSTDFCCVCVIVSGVCVFILVTHCLNI